MKNSMFEIFAFPIGLAIPIYQVAGIVKGSENMTLTALTAIWGALAGGCFAAGLIYFTDVKNCKMKRHNNPVDA